MFESLQQGLSSAIRSIRGRGKLTESNMRDGLKLVQQALLEADASYSVVKKFMANVTEQATGEAVLKRLDPTQQIVDIVNSELINLMGPVDHSLHLKPGLTILMLCGLQGSGKTTTCGKLAQMLIDGGKRPMMVAADLQRPAAIHQLEVLGERLGVPVHSEHGVQDPVAVCHNAVKAAKSAEVDVLILDTAGRLHVDDELMKQLENVDRRVNPDQIYFVVDSMTGQDAVNSAKAFNDALELDGVILTKLDGDARGGAALSVKEVTGVPIKFIGTGEGLDALEPFHPDRMAGRILGMGDMMSLIEDLKKKTDEEEIRRQEESLKKGEFTLDNFRSLMKQTRRLGPMGNILKMLPGMGQMADMMSGAAGAEAEAEMNRMGGIIDSMTQDERRNPKIIDQSRRRRIAAGAGVQPEQISQLVKQFEPMADLMKNMANLKGRDKMKAVQELTQQMQSNPHAGFNKVKKGTGKRLSPKEKAKLKKEREKAKRLARRNKK